MRRPRPASPTRGSALIIAMVTILLLVGYSAVLLSVSLANARHADAVIDGARATCVAEAGLHAALAELNAGVDADGDGLGTLTRNYPNPLSSAGGFEVRMSVLADGNRRLVARGTAGPARRAIEAIAAQELPFPETEAALGLFGPAGKHAKFKLFSDRPEDDPNDPDVRDTVRINGYPADGGAPVPAIAVQDPLAYARIREKLSQEISTGRVSPGSFAGSPSVEYVSSRGYRTDLPIALTPSPRFSPELLAKLRDDLIARTTQAIVPAADRTLAANNVVLSGTTTWGVPAAPQITVVTANNLRLESDAVLRGNGVLVIRGELKLTKGATLDWTGSVIVLGNEAGHKDSAKLQSEGGNLNVMGNVFVLGTDAGAADFRLVSLSNQREGSAHVTGAVLIMGGPEEKQHARLAVTNGDVAINGLLAIVGEKATLKVEEVHQDTSSFTAATGAAVICVPDSAAEQQVQLAVKLHGNTALRFDRTKVEAALAGLLPFMEQFDVPLPWRVKMWREVSPHVLAGP